MTTILLTLAALLSAAACIVFEYAGNRRGVYFFKPATMVCIIAIALSLHPAVSTPYRYWVLIALVFSLAGDIMLMLPRDRFLYGLGAFLLAHWCYIAAFSPVWPDASLVYLLPWLLGGALLYALLRPSHPHMRFAVIAYMLSILVMGWLAVENWRVYGDASLSGQTLAAIGAMLFVVSDALIGLSRFRANWRSAQALVLGSYFPAQWLIALSVAG